MQISSLTQKGQITIPVAVRRALGLNAGDEVAFETEGDRVYLRAVPTRLEAGFGLVKARQGASLDDIERAIRRRGQP